MKLVRDYTKLSVVNDMLRSFELKNYHENLEEQQDNPLDKDLQSTSLLPIY
jgi:hypothetical protein